MVNNAENKEIIRFDDLSKPVRDWLASTQLTYLISKLNRQLDVSSPKRNVIPELIFQFITSEVKPENFTGELSKRLEIDHQVAREIAKEIVQNILRPIEVALRDEAGINVTKILLGGEIGLPPRPAPPVVSKPIAEKIIPKPAPPPPSPALRPAPPPIAPKEVEKAPMKLPPPAPMPPVAPIPPPMPAAPVNQQSGATPAKEEMPELEIETPQNGLEPFIIHRETKTFEVPIKTRPKAVAPKPEPAVQKPSTPPASPKPKPAVEASGPPTEQERRIEMKINHKETVVPPPRKEIPIRPEPQAAKLLPKIRHEKMHRIVHYSNLRSPIGQDGEISQNAINNTKVKANAFSD